jgi:hypothetical protein
MLRVWVMRRLSDLFARFLESRRILLSFANRVRLHPQSAEQIRAAGRAPMGRCAPAWFALCGFGWTGMGIRDDSAMRGDPGCGEQALGKDTYHFGCLL